MPGGCKSPGGCWVKQSGKHSAAAAEKAKASEVWKELVARSGPGSPPRHPAVG